MVLREAEERKLWKNIIVHVFKRQGAHIPTQRIYDFVNLALRRAEEVSSDLYKKQRNFPGNHSVQSLCLLRMKEKKNANSYVFLDLSSRTNLVQISYLLIEITDNLQPGVITDELWNRIGNCSF